MTTHVRAVVTTLIVSLATSACGGESAQEEATEKPTVQIAFVAGASDGIAARRGIDLALDGLNRDGAGAYRYAVSTVEARDEATAARECERLVAVEGLVAIIGAQSEEALAACTSVTSGAGLIYLSIAETSGELCADNLYQIAPLPNQRSEAEGAAAQLSAREGGRLVVSDYFETIQLPANDSFVAGLRERDPSAAPAPEAARAFDAVGMVAAAVAAGGPERAALLATLPAVRHDGPRGPVSFPPGARFATLNMFVGRRTPEGKIEPVSFRPAIAPKPTCG